MKLRSGFNRVADVSGNLMRDLLRRRRLDSAIRSLKSGRSRVVVGPWFGEVGFEILYWIPFLNFLIQKYDLDPSLVTVISRGNTAQWYSVLGDVTYRELFDVLSVEEFRRINSDRARSTGRIKQMKHDEVEMEILSRLVGFMPREADIIHPGVMYELFLDYWHQRRSVAQVEKFFRFEKILLAPDHLPAPLEWGDYVAVKFYFSDAFPANTNNNQFISRVILRLAEKQTVFLLDSNLEVDDHSDAMVNALNHPNVFSLRGNISLRDNLGIQTEIISKARAFVGNYGGFSYLAPFLGVPSYSCFSKQTFHTTHNDIMLRALLRLQSGAGGERAEFICMSTTGMSDFFKL